MLSVDFVLSMLFMKNVMTETKLAETQVHNENVDIISGVDVMRQIAEVMEKMRAGEVAMNGLIDVAKSECQEYRMDVTTSSVANIGFVAHLDVLMMRPTPRTRHLSLAIIETR